MEAYEEGRDNDGRAELLSDVVCTQHGNLGTDKQGQGAPSSNEDL
jgi:hypothetical protein